MESLKQALYESKKSGRKGYKSAKQLLSQFDNQVVSIQYELETLKESATNNVDSNSISENELSKELREMNNEFSEASNRIRMGLSELKKEKSDFNIVLFGRTMAGKSTLMEILTQGDGDSIGKGAQRTTRDVRKYSWNNLTVVDVPGIAAFGGSEDDDIAFEAAKRADLIIFLITDDAPSPEEARGFAKIRALGKNVIILLNIKMNIGGVPNDLILNKKLSKRFSEEHVQKIVEQFKDFGSKLTFQDWDSIPVVPVHLNLKYEGERFQNSSWIKMSNFGELEKLIINQVKQFGRSYRYLNYLDAVEAPLTDIFERLWFNSYSHHEQSQKIDSKNNEIRHWQRVFEKNARDKITNNIKKSLAVVRHQIPDFAEDNYQNKKVSAEFKKLLEKTDLELSIKSAIEGIKSEFEKNIAQFNDELIEELDFINEDIELSNIKIKKVWDLRKASGWISITLEAGAVVASIITGVAAIAVVATGIVGVFQLVKNWIFKPSTKQKEKVRKKLEGELFTEIDKIEKKSIENAYKIVRKQLINGYLLPLVHDFNSLSQTLENLSKLENTFCINLSDSCSTKNRDYLLEIGVLNSQNFYLVEKAQRAPGYGTILKVKDKDVGRLENEISRMTNEPAYVVDSQQSISEVMSTLFVNYYVKYIGGNIYEVVEKFNCDDQFVAKKKLAEQLEKIHIIEGDMVNG